MKKTKRIKRFIKTNRVELLSGFGMGLIIIGGYIILTFSNNTDPGQPDYIPKTVDNHPATVSPVVKGKKTTKHTPAPKPTSTPTPSKIINLTNWKLTLPVNTSHDGVPDEIKQPELAKFTEYPYFFLNSLQDGVVFRAYANGATTPNSSYPRSELREMTTGGKSSASWSAGSGTHIMTATEVITHLPVAKPEVVAAQIHDSSSDVIEVRLEKSHLFVESDGKNVGDLDNNYHLGRVFSIKISVVSNVINVYYNSKHKVTYHRAGSGYYFKAGCYVQSNTQKGDKASAYGEVIIYSLNVNHS